MKQALGNLIIFGTLAFIAAFFGSLQGAYILVENPTRGWLAAAAMVAFIGFCAIFLRPRHVDRVAEDGNVLIIYATQTGVAEDLAKQTAARIERAVVIAMDQLSPQALKTASRSLWIVSTTGEGDPPDMALPFLHANDLIDLTGHSYALLALGDRSYAAYCGFGHAMSAWLDARGAVQTQALIEVDNADPDALNAWQGSLGLSPLAISDAAPFEEWVIAERILLNPGSLGWPAYRISLKPRSTMPSWRGGDIAQIADWNGQAVRDSQEWREYSIASIPGEGAMQLLVRLTHHGNGEYGLISGLLCRTLKEGDPVALRIRGNPSFHASQDDRPMILIGNGTGIAGLRSLIRTRIAHNHLRTWLIFGERQRDKDFHFGDELLCWHAEGKLAELSVTFSRDPSGRYVYHALEENAEAVAAWIADGADIFVCGSRASMGADVDRVLRTLLGTETVDQLIRDNRYRRDVY